MSKVFKVALPGYDAFEDNDPDHFALFVDQAIDYVLIKEKLVQSVSVSSTTNIAHGLSYVPFCLVFAEMSPGVWRKLFSTPIDGSGCWFQVDGTNLILKNTTGSDKNFAYHIFYDNVAGDSANEIALSDEPIVVVAKIGKNVLTSKDPNDFIFHSAYNTFKIIFDGRLTVSLAGSTNNQTFTKAHNQSFVPLVSAFAKQAGYDQVFLPNANNISTWGPKAGAISTGVRFNSVSADATNLIFNFDNSGGAVDVTIKYYILEKVN